MSVVRVLNDNLSGNFSARQAQREVVKIKIWIFPTGLEVHLEDMFSLQLYPCLFPVLPCTGLLCNVLLS